MIVLFVIYIVGALMTYMFLIGRSRDKQHPHSARKAVFGLLWPVHALGAYNRMLKSWEEPGDE